MVCRHGKQEDLIGIRSGTYHMSQDRGRFETSLAVRRQPKRLATLKSRGYGDETKTIPEDKYVSIAER